MIMFYEKLSTEGVSDLSRVTRFHWLHTQAQSRLTSMWFLLWAIQTSRGKESDHSSHLLSEGYARHCALSHLIFTTAL